MKKTKGKIYLIELVLVAILFLCTLFSLTKDKNITAISILLVAVILSLLIKNNRVLKANNKKILVVVIIFAILYVALFYAMGLYAGYYKANVRFNLSGIINYIVPITMILVGSEIIRNKLLVDQSKRSKLLIVIIGTLIDISLYRNVYNVSNLNGFLAFVGLICFSAIANNLLYTYLNDKYGMKPVIVYKLITTLYIYIIPITPDIYIYFRIFVRMFYPLIIYLYLDKYYDMDKYMDSKKERRNQIISMTVTTVVVIILIALISCQFSAGILVIGSSSMSGSIEKGDAIFYKKSKKKLEVGDVIVFKRDNIRVVHRITNIRSINDELRYYTKGDANDIADTGYITDEALMGKVLFKIKYIGRPTLWLRDIFE